MRDRSRLAGPVVAIVLAGAACADAPRPSPGVVPDHPDVARIVCEADGSTIVSTSTVLVQPDGVHVRVESHLDEPASVNGWGFDVDPGRSAWVMTGPPGLVQTACWPYSDHDSGEEPPPTPVEVLDPDGLYVDPEVDCTGQVGTYIADYGAPGPDFDVRIPLEEAREEIRGLRSTDQLVHGGYPEAVPAPVLVVRDGGVVASFSFAQTERGWTSPGGTICGDADLSVN